MLLTAVLQTTRTRTAGKAAARASRRLGRRDRAAGATRASPVSARRYFLSCEKNEPKPPPWLRVAPMLSYSERSGALATQT